MGRLRPRQGLYALVAISSLVLAPTAASAATNGGEPHGASHPRTVSLAGQVALRGRVTNYHGIGLTGARVLLYAWPSNWRGTYRHERVPTRLVGNAVSSANGDYAVRISSPAALTAYELPDGTVNLQAFVVGAALGSGFYPFSIRISSTPAGPVLAGLWTRPSRSGAPETAVLRVSGSAWKTPSDECDHAVSYFQYNFAKEWADQNQTYMRYSGMEAEAVLDESQTSTFDVGISYTGDVGSFTASGNYTASRDYSYDYGYYSGPATQDWQENYYPGYYENLWEPGGCFDDYFTQPNGGPLGGHNVASAGSVPDAGYCDTENPGGTFTQSTTESTTISLAMGIPEIGFTASAQTGWTSGDTISYKNTDDSSWRLCGQYGHSGSGAPGRLVAGAPS